jgi:hypothetical protein
MTYTFPPHKTGTTFNGVDFQLVINGTAKDLTGAVINMEIGGEVFSTATGELVVINAQDGKFQFKEQRINLPPFRYNYEIDFLFTGGIKKTYLTGTWKITA